MLSLKQMERVLGAADAIVPLDDAEVTTEANPGTVIDEEYLRGLRSLGINRISFGVQSLHDPTLRMLGRIHTAGEALATYEQALRAGFSNINLDFIFGLPGQTAEQWAWTLDRLAEIGPRHVSLYSLIVEPGTPLHQQVTRGSITVPDDDAAAEMYELAMEKLADAGYEQYEISNWAKQAAGKPEVWGCPQLSQFLRAHAITTWPTGSTPTIWAVAPALMGMCIHGATTIFLASTPTSRVQGKASCRSRKRSSSLRTTCSPKR